jgi:hypothetical protein
MYMFAYTFLQGYISFKYLVTLYKEISPEINILGQVNIFCDMQSKFQNKVVLPKKRRVKSIL